MSDKQDDVVIARLRKEAQYCLDMKAAGDEARLGAALINLAVVLMLTQPEVWDVLKKIADGDAAALSELLRN